jgi:hypothetical protein
MLIVTIAFAQFFFNIFKYSVLLNSDISGIFSVGAVPCVCPVFSSSQKISSISETCKSSFFSIFCSLRQVS